LSSHTDPALETKLGEIVQIKLKTTERVRGCVIERTSEGFRLSNSLISSTPNEKKEKDQDWTPFPGFIEVDWTSIESLEVMSLGP